jgi:enoyl-CoA hydratase/carnithine racemase
VGITPVRTVKSASSPDMNTISPGIRVERDAEIASVALDNPGKLNALTLAMWGELAERITELSTDESVRCIVLRGAGDEAFAAGADIAEFERVRDTREQAKTYHRQYVSGALRAIAECRHPTIAMIRGPCAGGGLEIACQCDLRISARSGRFGVPINRLGFAIAYDELASVLPLIGKATALEILLEGRMLGADEAFAKGLLTRVVADENLEEEAYATARRIAAGAPLVARWHKQYVRRLLPAPAPLTEAEIDANFDSLDTEDYRIGRDAFLRKTKPRFVGR